MTFEEANDRIVCEIQFPTEQELEKEVKDCNSEIRRRIIDMYKELKCLHETLVNLPCSVNPSNLKREVLWPMLDNSSFGCTARLCMPKIQDMCNQALATALKANNEWNKAEAQKKAKEAQKKAKLPWYKRIFT